MAEGALQGKRILLTRPAAQSERWAQKLREEGAIPVILPLIEIKPPADPAGILRALRDLKKYDYLIFTSSNAVEYFLHFLGKEGIVLPVNMQVGAVGASTSKALLMNGLSVHIVPSAFTAASLARALGNKVKGKKVLFPASAIAREELPQLLSEQGGDVDIITVYETVSVQAEKELDQALAKGLDVITFTSQSAIDSFAGNYSGRFDDLPVRACIGPVTAARAEELGMAVQIIPEEHTTEGLTRSIKEYFSHEYKAKKAANQ